MLINLIIAIVSVVCSPSGKLELVGMSPDGTWAAFYCLDETGGNISASKSYYVVDVRKAYIFAQYDETSAPRALQSLNIGMEHIDKLDLLEDSTMIKQRRGDGTWILRLKPGSDGYDLELTPVMQTQPRGVLHQTISQNTSGGTPKYRISNALANKLGITIVAVRTLVSGSSVRVPDHVYILDPDTQTCLPIFN